MTASLGLFNAAKKRCNRGEVQRTAGIYQVLGAQHGHPLVQPGAHLRVESAANQHGAHTLAGDGLLNDPQCPDAQHIDIAHQHIDGLVFA